VQVSRVLAAEHSQLRGDRRGCSQADRCCFVLGFGPSRTKNEQVASCVSYGWSHEQVASRVSYGYELVARPTVAHTGGYLLMRHCGTTGHSVDTRSTLALARAADGPLCGRAAGRCRGPESVSSESLITEGPQAPGQVPSLHWQHRVEDLVGRSTLTQSRVNSTVTVLGK
jgi:hypothetical protein